MKTIIELNEDDIAEVLAEHFAVEKSQVKVCPYNTTVGYGMQEQSVPTVKAEIIKP